MRWSSLFRIAVSGLLLTLAPAVAARAQQGVAAPRSTAEALGDDAAAVAARLDLPVDVALRHLQLQQASAAATMALADRFADRLAGVSIVHRPDFGIVFLLTGDAPMPDTVLDAGGTVVPVTFRTGAAARLTDLIQAITTFQATIRASLITPPGLGVDQRTGAIVAVVSGADVGREGAEGLRDRLTGITHVPVRLRVVDQLALDMAEGSGIEGGGRMIGSVPGSAHRFLCTAGFAVTDGVRSAMTTAAHCPDELSMRDAAGREHSLPFVGQWGWGNQDVQINASDEPLAPLFFADTAKTVSRTVTGAGPRAAMRAGEIVCHRGERTGYSCSEVELTDFAPAGDLCGGACLPTWTTVAGPTCKSGDSGSPVFLGTTAYGILKGGSYRADGSCAFYFFMSTDYLPPGWRLLTAADLPPGDAGGGVGLPR